VVVYASCCITSLTEETTTTVKETTKVAVSIVITSTTKPARPTTTIQNNPHYTKCGDGICDNVESRTGSCQLDCKPAAVAETPSGNGTVYIGIMVHLEGWDNETENKDLFMKHAQLTREMADTLEKYGAKATFEAREEFVKGCKRWDDNVLKELEDRGHGIGVHADVGGNAEQEGLTQEAFAESLSELKENMTGLGVRVRHVSGICSKLDWVQAAIEADYKFSTGVVAYCLMSMPESKRPPEYRNCRNPAACHDPYPSELEGRIHPRRVADGSSWLEDNPQGKLVLLTELGSLKYLDNQDGFTEDDVTAYTKELNETLALSDEDEVTIFYVSWSLGSAPDEEVLEKWLQAIQPYFQTGRVKWKTLPEMYDEYEKTVN